MQKPKDIDREIASVPFSACPAKTFHSHDGQVIPGRSVLEHCRIVGAVASAIIQRYPGPIRESLFPADSPLIAAAHDVGKISPTFFEKIRRACTVGTNTWPHISINPGLESEWNGHAGVSQAAAGAFNTPKWIPEILGQHHGFSPQIAGYPAISEIFGGMAWQQERVALISELKRQLKMDWPSISSLAQARVIAGLTSVADWIGSGNQFEDPSAPWQDKVDSALDNAGFVTPKFRSEQSFQQIFGFAPRPAQQQFFESVRGPGIYVLEAPTGLGKTEAALFAAYTIAQRQQATGIYFALPTQLTSNKIHERFNPFLDSILSIDSPRHRALLLHGKAWLQDTDMGKEGAPGGDWFSHSKRGLLAPFAVGTVDQALMAVMNVKHGFVRAFGLAGKVVILDEVHSYDAYTGTLLDALVGFLRQLHCTVIILSATLVARRRNALLNEHLSSSAYPLVTAVQNDSPPKEFPLISPTDVKVELALLHDDRLAVQEALDRASKGQQVLWIENTVREAQQRFLDLASRASDLGIDCGLLHSRYTASDRQNIENHWVDLFGKDGRAQRAIKGRILVGTQVLEQSLDIDADFLISRFAPTDMLLQRLGRLWRHSETIRPGGAKRQAWLLGPDLEHAIDNPKEAFGPTASVYAPYVLCRSLDVWRAPDSLILPRDTRDLLEGTYCERDEQGLMKRWHHELVFGTTGISGRPGRQTLEQLARIGLSANGKTLPESKAQTRYSESDSLEVLLLRELQVLPDHEITRITLLNDQILDLPIRRSKLPTSEWKKLTIALTQWMVPVRSKDAPKPLPRDTLSKIGFGNCFYLGDPMWSDDESALRIALVDQTGTLQGVFGAAVHDTYRLEYQPSMGYLIRNE